MKVTVKTDITQATISGNKREMTDLAVFLQAESFRRRKEFEQTSVMQCWTCLGVCDHLLDQLRKAGFYPDEGHP